VAYKSETPRGPCGLSRGSICPIPYASSDGVGSPSLYTLMADPVQELSAAQVGLIRAAISTRRFATYLTAAGFDERRALRLYMWNAQLGEAFHTPLQAVEVGLRNCVNDALSQAFTPNWWECANLFRLLDEERKGDLATVSRRIRNRGLELCTDQVVAGLSLGFWVGLLDGRYNPAIWSKHLRTSFPHFPEGRGRKSLFTEAGKVATLRNRISHHEPLIARNISQDFATAMVLLEWICPATAAWVRSHCRVPAILRQKP
jgi:hypothetical protein